MNSLLDSNDPLVLLFTARLRSQRRWLLAAGAVPALFFALTSANLAEPRLALIGSLLIFFVFYQLSCSVVLGRGLVALGGQANLDELLAANLEPGRLADRAALFSLLRAVFVSPVLLVAMALAGSAPWAAGVLMLGLLGQALATLSIYGSAYNNLFHSGQIPQADLWRSCLRCLVQMLLTAGCALAVALAIPEARLLMPVLLVPAIMIQQGFEARRALLNWMEARRLGKRTEFMARGKERPGAFWLWGAEKNPYLYRYHLSRLYWRGRPVWFLASTGFSTLLALWFVLEPKWRPIAPALGCYALGVSLMIAIFRQLRDLQNEMQSGNLDLAHISLGPQKLVEHLAEVGYRPRLWEMACLVGPLYLAALICEPQNTLCFTPALLGAGGFLIYQTRIAAYVNLLSLFWIRRYSRLDRLTTAAALAQWLAAMLTYLSTGVILGGAGVAATRLGPAETQPFTLAGFLLFGLIGWVFWLVWWSRFVRRTTVRFATNG